MKKAIKQLLRIVFIFVSGYVMLNSNEFGFFWWSGFIGAFTNGAKILYDLDEWLDN